MKNIVGLMLMLVTVLYLTVMNQSFAQSPDTLRLYANPTGETFEQQIIGDTTSNGQRRNLNRVYLLQQTGKVDTPYYYTDAIYVVNYNLTIIGRRNPVTGMPPVLQPTVKPNGGYTGALLHISTKTTIKLEGLYFLAISPDSVEANGTIPNGISDSVTVYVNHCVFDGGKGNQIIFLGNWGNAFITNSEFRNISTRFWQSGNIVTNTKGNPLDTLVMENNTFFCLGRSAYLSPGYIKYLVLNHNTFFLNIGGLLLATHLTNAKITNNIFYGVEAHGADSSYILQGEANDANQGFGIIMTDSLSTVGTEYGITEAQRKLVVKNNAYFWPDSLMQFYKTVDDTAKGWRIVPPVWMNKQTAYMFADHTDWPGFVSANNDSIDLGFQTSLTVPAVSSQIKFISIVGWNTPYGSIGNTGNFRWWQLPTNPYPGYIFARVPVTWKGWNDGYPVPENLKYSNTALYHSGTDGLPLGDLNWFPNISGVKQVSNTTPTKFELAQNYPNPFNPTTVIKYELSKSGLVSLKVYNILGQEVATLFKGFQKSGEYRVNFNASQFASGVYFYRLKTNGLTITKKMVLLK